MTPDQFLTRVSAGKIAPLYLFAGQESWARARCRQALLDRVLPPEIREEGWQHRDLEGTSVPEVIDDARSLSLFATNRLLWISSAELALPRRLAATGDEETGGASVAGLLSDYAKHPTAGTVLVFECSRYDFAGDDRARMDRVLKFYSAIQDTVEFRQLTPEALRQLGAQLARDQHLKLSSGDLAMLVEAMGGDAARLAVEIEKLAVYAMNEKAVTSDDIRSLVPNASGSTIFSLVNALGRRDRTAALRSLDILIREGEYLPLALTFLSTQFRLALAAKENRIASASQAQSWFSSLGIRMWRERAEQVIATAAVFDQAQLNRALPLIYETDKKFREGYRDDRVVMETLVFALTS